MTCSLRYTWLEVYDGEPVIESPEEKEKESEDDVTCPVSRDEQRDHPSSRETRTSSEEALLCERREQQRKRQYTYTWQVSSVIGIFQAFR